MNDASPVLEVRDVSKTFRLKNGQTCTALKGVSFTVREGGITALVGPDGAGKSTLLRMAAGLLRPDAGELLFENRAYAGQEGLLQTRLGYMPQRFGLYEDLTILENLELYADMRGVPMHAREERYAALLSMSGLAPFGQRLAGNLSGGMKQKLGLICTLASPPRLLLLDEPTVGVDPLSRRELRQIIRQLTGHGEQTGKLAKTGPPAMSVVVSTAYLDEAALCDDVVLLFEGASLAVAPPEQLKKRTAGMSFLACPAGSDTPRALQARLLDAPGIIDAVPQGGGVRFVHGPLDAAAREQLRSLLRGAEAREVPASLEDSFMLLLHERGQANIPAKSEEKADPTHTALTAMAKQGDTAPRNGAVPPQAEVVIETRHVSRLFGDFIAVNDVSFSVRKGEVFGLLGPNGAGKTTTFRMLCGLLPASSGHLLVAGTDVGEAGEEARRRMGYVAQKFSLYGPLSVRENMEFFAGAYGLRGQARRQRIREIVLDFSLEPYLDTPAENLPGGYKQRLALAVGLLHKPAILFLDEPTSGADPLARREFWKRIARLADSGVTVVVTTHFMEEAEYCDAILIQDSGVMLALGTPAEIRAQAGAAASPASPASSVSSANPAGFAGSGPAAATMEDAFISIVSRARTAGAQVPGEGRS